MSTATSPPPAWTAAGPRPVHWTCDEFHRAGDLGLFEGRRALLIDGVILEQGPMNPPHAVTLGLAEDSLRAAFGPGWRGRVQMPLVLGQDTDPVPDLAVLAGPVRGSTTHPTTADLVVEVADTSLRFDTTEKLGLYAAAGIGEYWVIDINGRVLLVFRDPRLAQGHPHNHDYTTALTLGPNDSVVPLAAPNATVRVADLLM